MNPVDQTRERLGNGQQWLKGAGTDSDGNSCLAVAISLTLRRSDRRAVETMVRRVAGEQFPERGLSYGFSISAFNDHPDTTWDDVALVLDKASVEWDESHSR